MIETMSLDEMRRYKGRQTLPPDMDDFWKNQIKSVSDIPSYQLNSCDFNLEFVD